MRRYTYALVIGIKNPGRKNQKVAALYVDLIPSLDYVHSPDWDDNNKNKERMLHQNLFI